MRRPEDEVLLQLSSPGLLQKSDMAIDDGKEVIIFRLIHELLDLIVPGSLVLVVAGDPKPAHITGAGPISIAINKCIGNQSCRAPPLCDTVVSGKYFIAEADQLTASILTAHADVSVTQAKSE